MSLTEWFIWVAGIVFATVVAWIGKVMVGLPKEYMPRYQIEQKFSNFEKRMHDDLNRQEVRAEKRFDKIDEALIKIMDKLDGKADKRG